MLLPLGNALGDEEFPPPPRSTVGSITQSTTAFGMELSIRKFESSTGVDDVVEFYRKLWGDGEYAESDLPPWRMITSRQDDQLYNAQVQVGGSKESWGYLSISDLPAKLDSGKYQVRSGEGFPKMAGSEVVNDQLSKDSGKTGRTLLLFNDFSPSSNATFYKNHYRNKGWEKVMSQSTATRERGYALVFRHGAKEVAITIDELDGKTSVVANEISKGLLAR